MKQSAIEKLEAEHALLVGALVAVKEFEAARNALEDTPYKYDFGKFVDAKREAMNAALAAVEPLIKNGKEDGR